MATKDTGMHLCQKMLKYSDEETKKSLIDKLVTETNLDFFYSKVRGCVSISLPSFILISLLCSLDQQFFQSHSPRTMQLHLHCTSLSLIVDQQWFIELVFLSSVENNCYYDCAYLRLYPSRYYHHRDEPEQLVQPCIVIYGAGRYTSRGSSRSNGQQLSLKSSLDFSECFHSFDSLFLQMPNVVSMTALTVYWKSDDRGKKQIKENLEKVISRCVNKELVDRSYFHEVFDFFSFIATTDELRSMLESLRECLPLLLSTRNGCLVSDDQNRSSIFI